MIDVSELITDPDFATEYTIYRSTGGEFGAGGWQEGTPEQIVVVGVALPANQREVQMVPEGDRVKGGMVFYSTVPFAFSHSDDPKGTSDKVLYKGEYYKLYQGLDRGDLGGYYKAIGMRIKGA